MIWMLMDLGCNFTLTFKKSIVSIRLFRQLLWRNMAQNRFPARVRFKISVFWWNRFQNRFSDRISKTVDEKIWIYYFLDRLRSSIIIFWWNKFQNHTGRIPTWDWYWFITGGAIGGWLCFINFLHWTTGCHRESWECHLSGPPVELRWIIRGPRWTAIGFHPRDHKNIFCFT